MKSHSVLFVGCGDLGCRAGRLLLAEGWTVAGLRRTPARLPAGFIGLRGDYRLPGDFGSIARLRPDCVVATFVPASRSVEGYREGFALAARNLLAGLGSHRPRLVLMISSTRVYAEREGGWVDEFSPLATGDPRAAAIIEAEQVLNRCSGPVSAIRFAGIYGDPAGRLLDRLRRGELCSPQPLQYSNRIHRDDCAGFLCHLARRAVAGVAPEPVYNGVDDAPVPRFEVESWLATALGVTQWRPVELSVSAQEFMNTGHKRCSNRLLHASGYTLLYPDYRAGYRAVLAGTAGDEPSSDG